ncbi:VOC family protein [Tritonibacter horizontis]|uniref:Glyoxalase/bleomycin resistance protein/dioxygenase superfamily protein n=1 Tax=Tritonibacter horizontis TaxID=1768241 RepID=A0A132C2W0_9RHOB|nr:VOC family protein [Tritonibacter horizontis]KUP94437.1 glyoxalase/bleomycin resistance protein/dioxygenase superfamily protein [Tritonibacter horizontis]
MTAQTRGLDHLGLTVGDLDASLGFFTGALGWTRIGGNPDYPSAYVTDGHARITLWQQTQNGADFDRHANIGLHHWALNVETEAALTALFETVEAHPGVVVEFAPEPSGSGPKVHFMVREPGGTRMEVSYDPR